MSAVSLIAFSVFFCCCALQFWFLHRVKVRLIERHPDVFLSVEKSSIFPKQGLWKFVRTSRYKELGDRELERRVLNLRWLLVVAIGAWMVLAFTIFNSPFAFGR